MLQQGGRAEESLHTWLRWAACTLCWHCASQAWHPARGCGRAVLSRARSERRQLGQTRKEDGKGMGRQHRSQKSTQSCSVQSTALPALGRLQLDTQTHPWAQAAPEMGSDHGDWCRRGSSPPPARSSRLTSENFPSPNHCTQRMPDTAWRLDVAL